MPPKTTSKTTARKPATAARKTVKPAVAPEPTAPKATTSKSPKIGLPPKPVRTPVVPAPPAARSRAAAEAAAAAAAAPVEKPAKRPPVETVSLIDEKKPRPKRPEGQTRTARSILPPISRIVPPPAPVAPPKPVEPTPAPRPVRVAPTVTDLISPAAPAHPVAPPAAPAAPAETSAEVPVTTDAAPAEAEAEAQK